MNHYSRRRSLLIKFSVKAIQYLGIVGISWLCFFVITGCWQFKRGKISSTTTTNQQIDLMVELTRETSPKLMLEPMLENTADLHNIALTEATTGWHKNLMVDDVPYDLYIPPNYNKNSARHQVLPVVLVLPGWNYPRTKWVEDTPLVEYANQYGYALILPEMLMTIYESAYYPETEMRWNSLPGGKFIQERFIPTIQQRHHLLKPGSHNTLLGFSTGGRGVALIALENPGLFVAGASLAGDFSQENLPDDNLMTAVYGSFYQFPERWTGRDNPQRRSPEWMMPLYLAHGTDDAIVPPEQSRLFYEALVQHHGDNLTIEYQAIASAGHDAGFLTQQLPNVFNFFQNLPQQIID